MKKNKTKLSLNEIDEKKRWENKVKNANKGWEDNKEFVQYRLEYLIRCECQAISWYFEDNDYYRLEIAANNIHQASIVLSYLDADNFTGARLQSGKGKDVMIGDEFNNIIDWLKQRFVDYGGDSKRNPFKHYLW